MTSDQHMATAFYKGGDGGPANVHRRALGIPRLVLPVYWCFPTFSSLGRVRSGAGLKTRTPLLGLDYRSSHGSDEVNKALRESGTRSWHRQQH